MSKKSKKQKTLFYLSLGGKNIAFTKIKLQWIALSVLILSAVVVQALGVYSYAYGYAVCRDKPLEIRGNYYKIPYDEGYGIHAGSDYDRCWGESTMDLQRDPATKAGKIAAAQSAEERDLSVRSLGYALYIPANYIMTELNKSPQTDKKNVNVGYQVTTNSGNKYDIREMNKESDFNYASLCSMPKQKYWYGVVIGKDKYNQPICKQVNNPNYNSKSYNIAVNLGNTGIVISARNTEVSQEVIDSEIVSIINAMEPYVP